MFDTTEMSFAKYVLCSFMDPLTPFVEVLIQESWQVNGNGVWIYITLAIRINTNNYIA